MKIKDAKLYVPVVTLSKGNVELRNQLSEGFERSFYFNKYKVIPNKNEVGTNGNQKYIRELFDSSYQGVKRLFILAYSNVENNWNKTDISSFKK